MAARPTFSSTCFGSELRPTWSKPTGRFPAYMLAVALLLGLGSASPGWAQWGDPGSPGREARPGPGRAGRLIPEVGGDRMEPLITRSLPRFRPPVKPQVTTSLAPREYKAVKRSFVLALDRVESNPVCAGLFSKLGTDGSSSLRGTYYMRADVDSNPQCTSSVAAYTHVGGHRCWLCPYFGSLSTNAGAVILIHEALHAAGLSESTVNPEAPSPAEINRMVRKACSLD